MHAKIKKVSDVAACCLQIEHRLDCRCVPSRDAVPTKSLTAVISCVGAHKDRYNWKTPYMTSAGGIVSMSCLDLFGSCPSQQRCVVEPDS